MDETREMLLSDVNNLDAVVHELGIEDSHETPAEAVCNLKAEIIRLHFALQRYGMHTWDCAFSDSRGELPCDCGWQRQQDESHGMASEEPDPGHD